MIRLFYYQKKLYFPEGRQSSSKTERGIFHTKKIALNAQKIEEHIFSLKKVKFKSTHTKKDSSQKRPGEISIIKILNPNFLCHTK